MQITRPCKLCFENRASVKEKNHLLEKESLRNDLMKSETEANKALANLKHK